MAGYTRQDGANNIANGNVIDADDFDAEYNAIEAAFNEGVNQGHKHDGSAGEGAPITKVGPSQDIIVSAGAVTPKTTNFTDLGSTGNMFKDAYFDGIVKGHTIAAGNTGNLIITNNEVDVTAGDLTLDIAGDININVDGGDVVLLDDTVTWGSLNNNSGNLIIKSNTTTAATFTNADIDLAGKLDVTDETTLDNILKVAGVTTLNGGLVVSEKIDANDTDKFTVADNTGNTVIQGTLEVVGSTTLSRLVLDNFILDSTTLSLSTGDLSLDVSDGNVLLKDDGVTWGGLSNNSGSLVIKSGTATAITFSGINSTLAGNSIISGNTTISGNTILGTDANNTVTINSDVASNIIPSTGSFTLGDATTTWQKGFFGEVETTGNIIVGGDLTVSGTTTTINTTNLSVEDPLIDLARNNTSDSVDIGVYGKYNDGTANRYTGFFRDATDEKWKLFKDTLNQPSGTVINTSTASSSGYAVATLVANLEGNISGDITGNITGDIKATNGSVVLNNGTDGTDATFTGSVTGNASTATLAAALTTARTITLGGDLTGSVSFKGDADVTLTATVTDDSHNHTIANVDGLQNALDGKETADAEILKADTDDNITAGYTATADDDGTKSSGTYTPSPAGGNLKRIINGGAFTLAAPTAAGDYTLVIQMTNNASAGTVTLSGFTKSSGGFTTTDTDDFFLFITKINGFTHLQIQALQ